MHVAARVYAIWCADGQRMGLRANGCRWVCVNGPVCRWVSAGASILRVKKKEKDNTYLCVW